MDQVELEKDPVGSLQLWKDNMIVLGPDFRDRVLRLQTLAILELDEKVTQLLNEEHTP